MAKLPTYSQVNGYSEKTIALNALSGGIVLSDLPFKLGLNQSPDCKNVWFANNVLGKRMGQEYVPGLYGTGNPITSAAARPWNGKLVYQSGSKLMALDVAAKTITPIYTALSSVEQGGTFVEFGEYLYFQNGCDYLRVDSSFTAAPPDPYIPVVLMNSKSAGGGDLLEDYNRLGAGYTVKFSGTETCATYQLPAFPLDSYTAVVTLKGKSKACGTDFTVDGPTGVVTFTDSVVAGTNELVITAYKTDQTYIDSIKKCTCMTTYGGDNEVKIVVGGNPDSPNCFYASGTQDGSYFPDNLYNLAGSGTEKIVGFGKQYDILVILKEHSLWGGTYSVSGAKVRLPVTPINQNIGCDCPYTIQTVNNTLVWCNTSGGVYGLFSTTNDDERNVLRLSGNINGTRYRSGLLNEPNLKKALSVDFDGRYYLCVNGKVYLWDYSIQNFAGDEKALSWWLFDKINPTAFSIVDRELWFGLSDGIWARFVETFSDFGEGINAVWWMAATDFGSPRARKTVTSVVITSRGSTATRALISYRTDQGQWTDPTGLSVRSFSLKQFTLRDMTLRVVRFAKIQLRRPFARHIGYFQIGFSNHDVRCDMSIPSLDIHYYFEGDVK